MKKYLCRVIRNGEDVISEPARAEFAEAALQNVICRKRGKLEKHGCATCFSRVEKASNDEFRCVNGDTEFSVETLA